MILKKTECTIRKKEKQEIERKKERKKKERKKEWKRKKKERKKERRKKVRKTERNIKFETAEHKSASKILWQVFFVEILLFDMSMIILSHYALLILSGD